MRDQKLTSRGLWSTLRKETITLRGWGITLEKGMAREQELEELKDTSPPRPDLRNTTIQAECN